MQIEAEYSNKNRVDDVSSLTVGSNNTIEAVGSTQGNANNTELVEIKAAKLNNPVNRRPRLIPVRSNLGIGLRGRMLTNVSNVVTPTSRQTMKEASIMVDSNVPNIGENIFSEESDGDSIKSASKSEGQGIEGSAITSEVVVTKTGKLKKPVVRSTRLIAARCNIGSGIRGPMRSNASNDRQTIEDVSNASDSDYDNIGANIDSDDSDVEFSTETNADHIDETDSNDEVSDDDDIDQTEIKNGPKDNHWRFERSFESLQSKDTFLAKESWWSFRSKNQCTDGVKTLYRCNRVKRTSKEQCQAGIYIVESSKFAADGPATSYSLYRKSAIHTHKRSPEYKEKITNRVKDIIIDLYKCGRKPKNISFIILADSSVSLKDKPSYIQIRQTILNFKNNGSGSTPLTMRKLTDFVKSHMQVPTDDDTPFVILFERSPPQQSHNKFFRFFISTKRLLKNAADSNIVHADATHKVTTEKIPLIAVGVTDYNSKFHFAGMTLSNHEASDDYKLSFEGLRTGVKAVTKKRFEPDVLVCDADAAIHNAYKAVFVGDEGNYLSQHLLRIL
ncbi:uncharacterized protein LOC119082090 [Bradysia coprophila]|nr:uncharacterized protein LOC119082090 [Bradysia coprophila]